MRAKISFFPFFVYALPLVVVIHLFMAWFDGRREEVPEGQVDGIQLQYMRDMSAVFQKGQEVARQRAEADYAGVQYVKPEYIAERQRWHEQQLLQQYQKIGILPLYQQFPDEISRNAYVGWDEYGERVKDLSRQSAFYNGKSAYLNEDKDSGGFFDQRSNFLRDVGRLIRSSFFYLTGDSKHNEDISRWVTPEGEPTDALYTQLYDTAGGKLVKMKAALRRFTEYLKVKNDSRPPEIWADIKANWVIIIASALYALVCLNFLSWAIELIKTKRIKILKMMDVNRFLRIPKLSFFLYALIALVAINIWIVQHKTYHFKAAGYVHDRWQPGDASATIKYCGMGEWVIAVIFVLYVLIGWGLVYRIMPLLRRR